MVRAMSQYNGLGVIKTTRHDANSEIIMKRGAFIALEGVDRSGKTTQAKRLVESLINESKKAKLYNFPILISNI